MPNILHKPKFKPVECEVCGCRYEHEEGDYIAVATGHTKPNSIYENSSKYVCMTVGCPVCGNMNILHKDEN